MIGCGGGGGDPSGNVVGENVTVQDDYVVNALVWCDANGDGVLGDDEEKTFSSADQEICGEFTLTESCTGDKARYALVGIDDGVHVTQNMDSTCSIAISNFTGSMFAPVGYEYVTPLSTMVEVLRQNQAGDQDNANKSVEEQIKAAEAQVQSVFGLTSQDIGSVDINAAGAENKEVKKAALVVQQILLDSTSAMQGAVGKPITPVSFSNAAKEMAAFVEDQADKIEAIDAGGGTAAEKAELKSALRVIDTNGEVKDSVVADSVTRVITDSVNNNSSDYGTVQSRVGVLVEIVKDVSKDNVARVEKAVNNMDGDAFNNEMLKLQTSASQGINAMVDSVKGYLDETEFNIVADHDVRKIAAVMNTAKESLKTIVAEAGVVKIPQGSAASTQNQDNLAASQIAKDIVSSFNANVDKTLVDLGISVDKVSMNTLGTKSTYVAPTTENRSPVADDLNVSVVVGKTKTFKLPGSDPDGNSIVFSGLTATNNGPSDLTTSSAGSVTFDATNQSVGEEPFLKYTYTYTVTDSHAETATGKLTVKVVAGLANNLTPIANAASFSLNAKGTLVGTLSGFDLEDSVSDPAKPLTFALGVSPTHHTGTFALASDGTFTYINDNTAGEDSFTFTVTDSGTTSSGAQGDVATSSPPATVTFSVQSVAEQAEIDSLFLVPVYNLTETVVAGDTLIQDSTLNDMRGFVLSYLLSKDTITVSAGNFPFSLSGQVLTFDAVAKQYGKKISEDNAVTINLSLEGGKAFSYSDDKGETHHLFTLVGKEEICAFTFDTAKTIKLSDISSAIGTVDKTLLDDISLMNGRDVGCE